MAYLYAKAAGGNWSSANTWSNVSSAGSDNSGPPTAADDTEFNAGSGSVTLDTNCACRSLYSTSYTGTITHNSGVTLSIGDGTAGASNRALRFSSLLTYTRGSLTTSIINFVSTSGTQQTIMTSGKAMGRTTFSGSGSWILSDTFSANDSDQITVTQTSGTLDLNGQLVGFGQFISVTGTRTLTFGSSTINVNGSWTLSTSNLTLNSGTSVINFTGTTFSGGGASYYDLVMSGAGAGQGFQSLTGSNSFRNLTFTGLANKTDYRELGGNQTASGTFACNGNSVTNRLLVKSTAIGTSRTITAATVSASHVDLQDITGAGAGSWNLSAITGGSGNCLGNSGITFTTAALQTATGTASFTWSTHGWTTRVPLPQDSVAVSNSFVAGQTVTVDMPRLGAAVDFSGCSGSPAVTFSPAIATIFGACSFVNIGTLTANNIISMSARSGVTFNSGGKTVGGTFRCEAYGGHVSLQSSFTVANLELNYGILYANTHNVNISGAFTVALVATYTKELYMGSGTWTLSGTGTVWRATSVGTLTLTKETSTIVISDTSATSKLFTGAGKTYHNITVSGDNVTIAGSNVFTTINLNTAGLTNGLILEESQVQTFTTLTTNGSSGNLAKLSASAGFSNTTLLKTNGAWFGTDYVHLTKITLSTTNTPKWFAGSHSTDNGSNSSNIVFSDLAFTGSSAVSVGGTTLSASCTFSPGTDTATVGVSVGSTLLSASATFTKPTYAITAGLTVGASTLSASATFTKPTYAITAALSVGSTLLAAVTTFVKPSYTAAVALVAGVTTLDAVASFTPVYSITASLNVGAVLTEAELTFTKPVYEATSSVTVGAAVLDAEASQDQPTYTVSIDVSMGSATLAANSTFTKPTYAADIALETPRTTLDAILAFDSPIYLTSVNVSIGAILGAATATFSKPTYQASVGVSTGPTVLSASVAFVKPTYTSISNLLIGATVISASATFSTTPVGSGRLLQLRRRVAAI